MTHFVNTLFYIKFIKKERTKKYGRKNNKRFRKPKNNS